FEVAVESKNGTRHGMDSFRGGSGRSDVLGDDGKLGEPSHVSGRFITRRLTPLGSPLNKPNSMNPFDAASPFDARYYFADPDFFEKLSPYVSENAQVRYLARVEAALADTLADFKVCPRKAAAEIARAARNVKPDEVYEEERRI